MGDLDSWVLRKQYEERVATFRTAWDLYIKFYTAFLAMNVAGLGVAVQYIEQQRRWPIVTAFVCQNVLTCATSVAIALYSRALSKHLASFVQAALVDCDPRVQKFAAGTPIPGVLAAWSGWANAIASLALSGCWIAVPWIEGVLKKTVQLHHWS